MTSLDAIKGIKKKIASVLDDDEYADELAYEEIVTFEDVFTKEGITSVESLATLREREAIAIFRDYCLPGSKASYFHKRAQEILDGTLGSTITRSPGFPGPKNVWGFVRLGDDMNEPQVLSSGCPSLDRMLEGGFSTRHVHEIYGGSQGAKTTLLHQVACASCLPLNEGGLDSPAMVFIDTIEKNSSTLLKCMASSLGMDPQTVVGKKRRYAPTTVARLIRFCEKQLFEVMRESGARVVVLDDLSTPFLREYGSDIQKLPERQTKARRVVAALKKVANDFNAVAIMANQVGILGKVMDSHVLLQLKPHDGNVMRLILERAVDLPKGECLLELTQNGFQEH